ncbi:MAG TPA: DUF4265 domain-containing protein [Cellvibrionaceae bacterium]
MSALQAIELFAGLRPDGQPIIERLPVKVLPDNTVQLVRSPAFVKGLAMGDTIRADSERREFDIVQHSGNLCVRVFTRGDTAPLAEKLAGPLAKLGGEIEQESPHLLVCCIHVSCGFSAIEAVFNDAIDADSNWLYGNVYDPADGVTPLNWWQPLLQPE